MAVGEKKTQKNMVNNEEEQRKTSSPNWENEKKEKHQEGINKIKSREKQTRI